MMIFIKLRHAKDSFLREELCGFTEGKGLHCSNFQAEINNEEMCQLLTPLVLSCKGYEHVFYSGDRKALVVAL
jgi:hypothetical protein